MAAKEFSADNITEKLKEWTGRRDTESDAAVLNLVYDELRRQAHRYLRHERAGHTLQTTALVHEVYLKLGKQANIEYESQSHFFAIAPQEPTALRPASLRPALRRPASAHEP